MTSNKNINLDQFDFNAFQEDAIKQSTAKTMIVLNHVKNPPGNSRPRSYESRGSWKEPLTAYPIVK